MMDGKTLEELRELVEFLKANEIAEFDMEQADLKGRIKFAVDPAAAGAMSGVELSQLSRLMAAAPAVLAPAAPAGAPLAGGGPRAAFAERDAPPRAQVTCGRT